MWQLSWTQLAPWQGAVQHSSLPMAAWFCPFLCPHLCLTPGDQGRHTSAEVTPQKCYQCQEMGGNRIKSDHSNALASLNHRPVLLKNTWLIISVRTSTEATIGLLCHASWQPGDVQKPNQRDAENITERNLGSVLGKSFEDCVIGLVHQNTGLGVVWFRTIENFTGKM